MPFHLPWILTFPIKNADSPDYYSGKDRLESYFYSYWIHGQCYTVLNANMIRPISKLFAVLLFNTTYYYNYIISGIGQNIVLCCMVDLLYCYGCFCNYTPSYSPLFFCNLPLPPCYFLSIHFLFECEKVFENSIVELYRKVAFLFHFAKEIKNIC